MPSSWVRMTISLIAGLNERQATLTEIGSVGGRGRENLAAGDEQVRIRPEGREHELVAGSVQLTLRPWVTKYRARPWSCRRR